MHVHFSWYSPFHIMPEPSIGPFLILQPALFDDCTLYLSVSDGSCSACRNGPYIHNPGVFIVLHPQTCMSESSLPDGVEKVPMAIKAFRVTEA